MTLSVLMPVKNAMPFLPQALASLEAQTRRDFVVLAWDNASTDSSLQTLRQWIPARLPGEVFSGVELSVGGTLRELTARASTPVCARMDGDDICEPERFARQLAFWQKHPGLAVLGTQAQCINEAGAPAGDYERLPLDHRSIVYALLRRTPLLHPTILFDRAAVLAAGNYRADRRVEDYELFLRLARGGAAFANLPDVLLRYRLHSRSAAQTMLRAGELHAQMLEDLAEHGPEIFGVPAARLRRLKEKRLRFALPLMRTVIEHRRKLDPTARSNGWRNPELVQAMRYCLSPRDWATRAALVLLDPAHPSPGRALALLLGKILRNLGPRTP